MESNGNLLENDDIGKLVFKMSVPLVISQFVNVFYSVVDRMYIGHIKNFGDLKLSAVGLAFPLIILITAFAMLVSYGMSPKLSLNMGEGNLKKANSIMNSSYLVLILICSILTGILYLFIDEIFKFLGASGKVFEFGKEYFIFYGMGNFFAMSNIFLNCAMSSEGFTKKAGRSILIGAILNIILDPIFIFLLKMDIKGAAIATVISQFVSFLYCFNFMLRGEGVLKLSFKNLKLERKVIFSVLSLGFAPFVMASTESFITYFFNDGILRYGNETMVSAMTIILSLSNIIFIFGNGISQGVAPVVSYNLGKKNYENVRKAVNCGVALSFISTFIMWLIFMAFPKFIIKFFTNNIEIIGFTKIVLRIYMSMIFVMSIQIVLQQIFVAFSNAKTSSFIAIFRKIILLIPFIYILPYLFKDYVDPVYLVFSAEPVADFCSIIMTVFLFNKHYGKLLGYVKSN